MSSRPGDIQLLKVLWEQYREAMYCNCYNFGWNLTRNEFIINPHPCGWGRIWLPNLWRGISLQRLKLWALKFVYTSINVSWVYLVKHFRAKKRRFRRFIGQNVHKTARFFAVFGYFVLLWRYIWLQWNSPPPPQSRALPPLIVGAPSSSGARTVSSSF